MIFQSLIHRRKTSSKKARRFDGQLSLNKRLIKKEAYLGGRLFGQLNKGQVREFFCLDKNTWVWHEVWTDAVTKKKRISTLRYDIRSNHVYKKQDNDSDWSRLDAGETENFREAVKVYRHNVLAKLYPDRDWS